MINHIVTNIVTKGLLNISAITKGFILPFFKYEIRRRGGGGGDTPKISSGYSEENLIRDLRNTKDEDIDYITVWVEWDKNAQKYDKKIYAELIKAKIQTTLLTENNLSNIKITVELI